MKKYLILIGLLYFGYKKMVVMNLKNIEKAEFRGFDMFLSSGVMIAYDKFKGMLDGQCMISPAKHAILRFDIDLKKTTDHYLGRALDVMLTGDHTLRQAYNFGVQAGFNAIGIYPFWKPYKGLHLGVRYPVIENKIYKWSDMSRISGKHDYQSYEKGFNYG